MKIKKFLKRLHCTVQRIDWFSQTGSINGLVWCCIFIINASCKCTYINTYIKMLIVIRLFSLVHTYNNTAQRIITNNKR